MKLDTSLVPVKQDESDDLKDDIELLQQVLTSPHKEFEDINKGYKYSVFLYTFIKIFMIFYSC